MTDRDLMKQIDDEIDRAERLLEIAHVARRLSCCHETVRRLIKGGKLRGLKIGGGWRIAQRDLDAFIAASAFTSVNNDQQRAS